MNANTYSHQNRRPKMDFSSSSNTRVDIDSEDEPKARKRSDSSEFDLHQLYHNALECLINCNRTIKSLREQSTSKDEQIAMLEGKLVQMSLELASSKELQDEQTQQLYRLKCRKSSARLDDNDEKCAPPRQNSQKLHVSNSLPSSMVEYSLDTCTGSIKADYGPKSAVRVPDIPSVDFDKNIPRAFWMPSLGACLNNIDDPMINDDRRKSQKDGSTNGTFAFAKGGNVNSSVLADKNGIARQTVSETDLTASQGKRRQGRGPLTASLNDTASARRLANIGHFFKGLNGMNDNDTTAQDGTMKRTNDGVSTP